MNDQARATAVAALTALAASPGYRDRADAGRCLASFAEMPEARGTLVRLVLDTRDTFVTRATVEALLRRQDTVGLAVVGSGLAAADPNHADWIHTAVIDVFGVFSRDRDAAVQACESVIGSTDEQTRRGVHQLIAMLADINPVLAPISGQGSARSNCPRGAG